MCGYSGPALQDWGAGLLCAGCADDAGHAAIMVAMVKSAILGGVRVTHRPSTAETAMILRSMAEDE